MEIVLIGGKRLKISLTKQEMERLSMNCETMNYADRDTRQFLVGLLELGKVKTGFAPKGAKLFVEVYPDSIGGCICCFTVLSRKAGQQGDGAVVQPVIFAFGDSDALCEGSARIFTNYGHRVFKSSLYHYGAEFRLVVYPLDYDDMRSVSFIGEYARKVGEGETLAAHIAEHGSALITETAIETLAKYFPA